MSKRKLPPPPEGHVLVHSEAYGDHYRKKRKEKPKLSDDMKNSSTNMKDANLYAKAVKDALDPFRKKIEDGKLWNRLVSLFKKQLKKEGRVNLQALEQFQCHSKFPLTRFMHRQLTAVVSEESKTLQVKVTTYGDIKTKWEKAEEYRQILIVVFYNADLDADFESKTVYFPLGNEKRNNQQESFPIPGKAIIALVALRCDFWKDGQVGGSGRKALEILRVMDLRGDGSGSAN